MTRIDFYTEAPDKVELACRIAGKAFRGGHKIVIFSNDDTVLGRVDRMLWTTPAVSFVPHCAASHPLAAETPVLLARRGEPLAHDDVLINLDGDWPPDFARFHRLAEIVATDEPDKSLARARYRFYRDRGYDIATHNMKGSTRD